MAEKTWLYIYEGAPRSDEEGRRSIYIGIGQSMGRVFESHNPDAERLRDTEGTLIRQTVKPFSSREDALKAEAIAIHVASLMGLDPIYAAKDEDELFEKRDKSVTNISGTKTSKHLGPAIFMRDGEVAQSDMGGRSSCRSLRTLSKGASLRLAATPARCLSNVQHSIGTSPLTSVPRLGSWSLC